MRLCRIISLVALLLTLSLPGIAREHKVQRGETYESIAKRYGVSVQALREANPRHKNCLTGLRIAIPDPPPPPPKPKPKPAPAPVATKHPVQTHQHTHSNSSGHTSNQSGHSSPQQVQGRTQCTVCHGTGDCAACHGTGDTPQGPVPICGPIVFDPGCLLCGRTGKCTNCGGTGYVTAAREAYNQARYESQRAIQRNSNSGSEELNLRYPDHQKYNDSRGKFNNRKYQRERQSTCSSCKGTGVDPYPKKRAGSRSIYHHPGGTKCKYCGQYNDHYHDKCYSCVP